MDVAVAFGSVFDGDFEGVALEVLENFNGAFGLGEVGLTAECVEGDFEAGFKQVDGEWTLR